MAKSKSKSIYFCKECGYESTKWLGQCPACKAWDSFVEEKINLSVGGSKINTDLSDNKPLKLSEVEFENEERIPTGISELDRVLGNGIVRGSLVLVGGDPGIGKSTLLLQMCCNLVNTQKKVLYVSGEESVKQIKMRANRIPVDSHELLVLGETDLDVVVSHISKINPEVVVIDSIQTMLSKNEGQSPGSVSQIRAATGVLMKLAKTLSIAIFIVGHVTKEGVVAGPRVLEHMVDTVLYFESDMGVSYRFLRAVKNRFGSTNEIGVFDMSEKGLMEVLNPSEYMLKGRPAEEPGSVVACSIEGTRPILVEIQALIARTSFNYPRRTSAGIDFNRMNLLIAVMEKRAHLDLSDSDAYINVAGGMRIHEPAMDLGVIMALMSSYKNKPIDEDVICFGEVGLVGEVRAVTMADSRVMEAAKLGFKKCYLPKVNKESLSIDKKNLNGMELIGITSIKELFKAI
ncbi:MAG: DNA repair protein RadA [Lachnospiraceae bacterium]|nr:DNA repair protein RadA [Lachnospiraceae bacterium]